MLEIQGSGSDWSIYSEFNVSIIIMMRSIYLKQIYVMMLLQNLQRVIVQLFSPRSLWDGEFQKKDFEKLKEHVSSLKLRTSWGLVGNNRIDNYQYLSSVTVSPKYNFGNTIVNGASFAAVNTDIKWETTAMFDLGIDVGFLNNSLNITADFFNNVTRDILIGLPFQVCLVEVALSRMLEK